MSGSNVAQLGYQSLLACGPSPASFTRSFVFVSEGVQKTGVITERQGLRGTRTHQVQDTRQDKYTVAGSLVIEPTAEDLAFWLPYMLGTGTGGTYTLTESLPTFSLAVTRGADRFQYDGCKIGVWTLAASKGDPIPKLTLEIHGQTETRTLGAGLPSGAPALAYTPPYIFTDLTLDLATVARQVESFSLKCDHQLITDRFMNSLTVVDLPEQDRIITLDVELGYTTNNADLYGVALAGVAGSLTLAQSNGMTGSYAATTAITFSKLQIPDKSPVVGGRQEIMLPLNFACRSADGTANDEMSVSHSYSGS